ncbi:MAG TPA: hypothetical protein VL332_05190 [Candidatus Saccharimonadaceae bacterium]|jgi:hypothetical protein|nr:hypothetical protein [Candidatus Saccharimonadaceae bacterium]
MNPAAQVPARMRTVVLGAMAVVLSWAGPAHAVAPPDSAQLGTLRSAIASGALIGISTSRYELLRRGVTVDESFVTVRTQGRAALVLSGAPESGIERRIPWADIEHVNEVHPRGGRGLLIGILVGGALGGALVAINGPDMFESGDGGAVAYAILLTSASATAGLVSGLANPSRHSLYP